jgi:hypothetical protein
MDEVKTCSYCNGTKPTSVFRPKKNECRACEAAKMREHRRNNPDRYREQYRRYNAKRRNEDREKWLALYREYNALKRPFLPSNAECLRSLPWDQIPELAVKQAFRSVKVGG